VRKGIFLSAADKLQACPRPRITKSFANLSPRRRRLSLPIRGFPMNNASHVWFPPRALPGRSVFWTLLQVRGYIAEAFAKNSREVLGMDLTEAMLAIARARTEQRGVKNISFRVGDAQNLPFDEGEFDVVVCRLALHHVQQPAIVVSGMARVCRRGGMVLVEGIYGSEHPARAAYQDCWEILRDPSHVRALPLSELLHIFRDAGLETETVSTADDLCPEVERWMATTKVPEERAAEIRLLLEDDLQQDLSGTRPFRNAAG
jgi:SAM-dependent methyltransferase